MFRAGDVNHIQVILFDDPVQMGVDKVLLDVVPQRASRHQFCGEVPPSLSLLLDSFFPSEERLDVHFSQSQGVADDGDGTQAHRGTRDDWAE